MATMRVGSSGLLLALCWAGVQGDDSKVKQGEQKEIYALRQAFASNDPKESERAAARLYTIGYPALHPLEQWQSSDNALLAERAQGLRTEIMLRLRYRPFVQHAAFTSNPDLVLVTNNHGTEVTVWLKDLATGKDLQYFRKLPQRIGHAALSLDGRLAACGGWIEANPLLLKGPPDYSIGLWDCASGMLVRRFTGHTDGVSVVAFTPDAKQLASASFDGTARIWEVATGKQLIRFNNHAAKVSHVAISLDGSLIATCGMDQHVRIWKRETGEEVARLPHPAHLARSSFSPDGRHLVTVSGKASAKDNKRIILDGAVRVWDVKMKKELRQLGGEDELVNHLAFDFRGKLLLTADDYSAHLWDVETGKKLGEHNLRPQVIGGIGFTPDGKEAIIVRWNGELTRWKLPQTA